MTTTPRTPSDRTDDQPQGLMLPGQAASPPGPCDLSGMYLMHHAFRRDLRDFGAAVAHTPLDDAATWSALRHRWERMAHHLHEHHSVEDRVLWPLLLERASTAGDSHGLKVLEAMEAEHALVDPLLERARDGFAAMASAPDAATRDTLVATLEESATVLDDHLGHEEREAVALVQRYVGAEEWDHLERTEFRGRPHLGDLRFQLPWIVEGVPAAAVEPLLTAAGLPFRVVLALGRKGFAREQRAAFGHVPPAA